MKKFLVLALSIALVALLAVFAEAESYQPGDIVEAEFMVLANPNQALGAEVILEYDNTVLELIPNQTFAKDQVFLTNLQGFSVGWQEKASFRIVDQSASGDYAVSLVVLRAIDDEKDVDGLVFSPFIVHVGNEIITPTKPDVPVFSEVYHGSDAHLKYSNDESFRAISYMGPGKAFAEGGGYKPYKQKKITAYFEEDGFVFVDVQYQTAEERFVYISKSRFDQIGNIPSISSLDYYNGTTTARIKPSWGPDNRFNSVESLMVDTGMPVKVFFQENGFVYAEYMCSKGTVRMWLPANNIDTPDANVTISSTPISPAGESVFN